MGSRRLADPTPDGENMPTPLRANRRPGPWCHSGQCCKFRATYIEQHWITPSTTDISKSDRPENADVYARILRSLRFEAGRDFPA